MFVCQVDYVIDVEDAEHIKTSPQRVDNGADVTTVLLVDNHGRPSYGRFLNVKPDVGLITSTARTFVQEGVTTEYATQVVGTTLDDGRLYAHLLSKTSRVISDGHGGHHEMNTKFDIDKNQISRNYFVKNTDFISPNQVDTHLVFPTSNPNNYGTSNKIKEDRSPKASEENIEEELLKGSPSNNIRVSNEERKHRLVFPQNNIKVFKIKSNAKDERENVIYHKEEDNTSNFQPSKVKEWDNIPTFTIRNEFSPSGFSYLGDLPEFDDESQEKKVPSLYDRRAKNLFRAGLLKPSPKELKTTTYKGFADFTTTVGDTVIIFTPHTSELIQKPVTKITVEPTIKPTVSFILPPPEMKTELPILEIPTEPTTEKRITTEETTEEEAKQYLQSKVIDKIDRQKYGKSQNVEQIQDMEAKASVLAHEQKGDIITSSTEYRTIPNSQVIESSESQTPLLSTPSHEDIAKIFASLQAQANKATEPLNTPSTIFFDTETTLLSKEDTKSSGGATTIFFEDELSIDNTPTQSPSASATTEVDITTNFVTESNLEGTTQSQELTLNNLPTLEKQSQTITEDVTTTEHESTVTTFSTEETTTDDVSEESTTTEAMNKDSIEEKCSEGLKVIPTTIYKTLTYLTTFFIPVDETTTTSINAEEVVTSQIVLQTQSCSISPTYILKDNSEQTLSVTTSSDYSTNSEAAEQTTTEQIQTTEQHITTEQELAVTTAAIETTPQEITTERKHVTESEPTTTEETTEDGEEIELIFKTLYTTYTYLTTYFQDTTSSIASRIVVTTNVVTSTLDPGSQSSEDAVAGLFDEDSDLVSSYKSRPASFEDFAEISPSQLDSKFLSSDIEHSEDLESSFTETPHLSEEDVATTSIAVKTYYTTYTYFTTIFVDGETEVSSRTEVYTNYVTPSIKPTNTYVDIAAMRTVFDENDEEEMSEGEEEDHEDEIEDEVNSDKQLQFQIYPSNKYNKTISRISATSSYNVTENSMEDLQDITTTTKDGYVTLRRTTTDDAPIEENLLNLNDYESVSTMVRSSTSDGERRLLNNVDKRNILDDQIVSESNNDSEIIPSPTLLLQTSYTTFTYFTTMYQGTTGSNVVSRLETVTNIVTETLTPSHTLSVEDLSLPITYFTTFTYWTTLYKQGTTKVTSREETISNVITPTAVLANTETSNIEITSTSSSYLPSSTTATSLLLSDKDDEYSTTVYTTYTYYTTSYVGDETVINSRLETVTSILNKTNDIDNQTTTDASSTESIGEENDKIDNKNTSSLDTLPTGLVSTQVNTVENSGTTTVLSTDVIGTYINGQYAQILESTSTILTKNITPHLVDNSKPTGIVSVNQGKIIDADEISTLYYTTQAIGTYINNVYAQVIQSTSSLQVNEEKKASLGTELPIVKRTGLVRLVQGSMIQNKTTTLYQSRVIGTVIDGRYAQIIESTSSFLVDKPSIATSPTSDISPTSTLAPSHEIKPTSASISPSSAVIEGSISESTKEEDITKELELTNTKTKPSFQSKKKTFKPGIRPFVQRPKSSYSPKRRLPGATSATTVTRNDFTPTVTAIPASKGRFGNRRNSAFIQPTSSGSRRFSRPKSTSSFGGRRGSSRIQPTSTGFGASSRRGFRSSSGSFIKSSGLFSNSARFRIRPTAASSFIKPSTIGPVTESSENEDDNILTTLVTDEPDESENETTLLTTSTTETSRRQNPLLRFRRPPLGRPPIGGGRTTTPRNRSNTANRNSNKATTTTPKPRTTRTGILNRNRPNGLFPRRNLFTTSTTQAPPEEEEEGEEDVQFEGDDETLIEENEEEDTDYEGSQKQTQTVKPPSNTRSGLVKIKPFNFRRRSKRDTYSRFRRPISKTTAAPLDEDYDDETPKPKPKYHNRFSSRSRPPKVYQSSTQPPPPTTPRKRITPNKVKPQSRTQFTLRPEKEKTNFRRPTSSRARTATTPRPRARTSYGNYQTDNSNHRKSPGRSSSRNTGNRRVSSRQKVQSQDINDNYIVPAFDGTITITHQIPTEVTIPVINGKITEYKNIVTARMSTEILEPAQYSTSVNPFGKEVKVLVNELTTIANNGATLITQFVLNETPTTSIIFTPTYIRNRKTSYSHIIPSTIYAVEQVVNTIQPALAAQAPLANILLSQLLLGGLQTQNPLLALQNPGVPPTPTTEYKTRTTTYVTTVTSSTSTVIPLTFRGKEILTTIVDSSVNVITATEFLTDTVVVTPTVAFPVAAPQLNTLLLPLLQQQLAQSPPPQLLQNASPQIVSSPNSFGVEKLNEPDTLNLALENDDKPAVVQTKPRLSKGNKKPKKPTRVEASKETSVITLYVSGKTPGEFSTVLSTIVSDAKERRRRDSGEEIKPSTLLDDLVISTLDYLDSYILPGRKDVLNYYSELDSETESLESILGDVNEHIKSTAENNLLLKPTKMNEFNTKKFKIKTVKSSSNQNELRNFLV
ncbi:hypothetical protein WA026_000010 [Henosepilachna vigintioctopunctata]|uniref:DUF4758 domain-containing protein n=1 Tax=Henosepilachna vigintioctopunctata TaxID=420089 RepID=A0AAW1V4F9_9CUCU